MYPNTLPPFGILKSSGAQFCARPCDEIQTANVRHDSTHMVPRNKFTVILLLFAGEAKLRPDTGNMQTHSHNRGGAQWNRIFARVHTSDSL